MTLAVTLTVEQLRDLVRAAVREELQSVAEDKPAAGPVTDEQKAKMRALLRRKGIGV